ncbi:MAG: GTPase [Burkholderiaceae bacterium]
MIPATLVTGASREAAIAEAVAAAPALGNGTIAVLLEGLPSGNLDAARLADLPGVAVTRIAPGCFCCTGNLTLRVSLDRILRTRPARLYIGLATTMHLDAIRAALSAPPYDGWLALTADIATGGSAG